MKFDRLTKQTFSRRFFTTVCLATLIAAVSMAVPSTLLASQQGDENSANQVAIEVRIDKTEVLIAERIHLEIMATAPQGVTVKFPQLDHQLGDFEVLSVKDTPDIPDGSNRKWIRSIGLESLVSGEIEIPTIELSYVDRRGSTPLTGLQRTPTQRVTVLSTLEGTEDPTRFRDIKSVVFLPEPPQQNRHWLVWAAGLAGGLAVAATVIAMIRRKAVLSPKQHAIKLLQDLKISRAYEDHDVEQVHIRLVNILRLYVQEHYAISAPRLTTHEFLVAMQGDQRLSDEFRAELSQLLSLADMVKFAGLLPSEGGLGEVVDQAVRLVENATEQSPVTTCSDVSTAEGK